MAAGVVFVPYQPKTILNKSRRADHWFWSRYSAYPYVGCQHGCEFCYCRERKFCPYDDSGDFCHVIKVKENAPLLLRRSLSRVPVDVVFTADYQPAEVKWEVSRRLLGVCHELGFPVFVLERSPLVLRDLDLLAAIHRRARAVVAFSILSTPDSPSYDRVRQLERFAPPAGRRFAAMEKLAAAGIVTGTCCMPILPGLSDDEATLRDVVRWTAAHGGQFVLAAGLTLADQQRAHFLGVLRERFPELAGFYESFYPSGSYGPAEDWARRIGNLVREECLRQGILDRIPRPIIPSDQRYNSKRVVEQLANRIHELELEGEPGYLVWPYRKAAWAVEDLQQDIGLVYQTTGVQGLQSIRDVSPSLARLIAGWLDAWPSTQRSVTPAEQPLLF